MTAISPRYSLTYGHDDLRLWCNPCAGIDEEPVESWYGAPTPLAEVVAAAERHDADHAADDQATGAAR